MPFKFLYPRASTTQSLDNKYIGISTAIVGSVNGTNTIHAFWQAEDVYDADGDWYHDLYDPNRVAYGRIGYARSTDGINFTRMHDSSGSLVAGATPVITHWQEEETCCAAGIPPNGNPQGVYGTAPPSIIEKDGYYYMFYTRLMDYRNQNRWIEGQWFGYYQMIDDPFWRWPAYLSVIPYSPNDAEYFRGNICVARAAVSSVNVSQSSYESGSNPWTKFYRSPYQPIAGEWDYQETWIQPGIGGYDTAILPTRGIYGKVSWNTYLQSYLLITYHDDGYFLLHQSNGNSLTSWKNGVRITEVEEAGKNISYPSLIGSGGWGINDKQTKQYNLLYYARDNDTYGGNHYMARRSLTFD